MQERRLERLAKKAVAAVSAVHGSSDESAKAAAAAMVQSAAVASTASAAGASAASGFVLPDSQGSHATALGGSASATHTSQGASERLSQDGISPQIDARLQHSSPSAPASASGPAAAAAACDDDIFDRESEDDEFQGDGTVAYIPNDANGAAGPRGWAFRRGHERWDPSASEQSSLALPGNGAVDVEALMALPPAMQEEYLAEIDKARRSKVREAILPVANNPLAFSSTQLSSFLKGAKVNVDIRNAQKAAAQASSDGNRIAGEANREYLLVKGGKRVRRHAKQRPVQPAVPRSWPDKPSAASGPTLPHLRQVSLATVSAVAQITAIPLSTTTEAKVHADSLLDDGSDWDSDSSEASDGSFGLQQLPSRLISKALPQGKPTSVVELPSSESDNSDTNAPVSSTHRAGSTRSSPSVPTVSIDVDTIKAQLDAELGPELLSGVNIVLNTTAQNSPRAIHSQQHPVQRSAQEPRHGTAAVSSDEGWSSGEEDLPPAAQPTQLAALSADGSAAAASAAEPLAVKDTAELHQGSDAWSSGSESHHSEAQGGQPEANTQEKACQTPPGAAQGCPPSPALLARGRAAKGIPTSMPTKYSHTADSPPDRRASAPPDSPTADPALSAALATASGMASWAQRAVQRAIKQHSSAGAPSQSTYSQSVAPTAAAPAAVVATGAGLGTAMAGGGGPPENQRRAASK